MKVSWCNFSNKTVSESRVYFTGLFLMAICVGVLAGCDDGIYRFNEDNVNKLLSSALSDINNVPRYACVSLPAPGVKLPGNTETASLMTYSGEIRSDVSALIDAGLITVRFNSGKGPAALAVFRAYARIKSQPSPEVSLSFVDLTELGRAFYRYDDHKTSNLPQGLYGENRFCAHIQYGGVEKYMKPQKNPFDNNPDLVSWVNFKWKIDEGKTPWLKNSVIKEALTIGRDKDLWSRSGILLELRDEGWGLGNDPYTIRW